MKNMKDKKISVLCIVLIVWLVFSTAYVIYGEYNRFTVFVAQRSYNAGITDSVIQLMEQSKTCQPIPVTANGAQVNLINIECLKAPADSDVNVDTE